MAYEYPPMLSGTQQEQLAQLWDYLYRLAETLSIDGEQTKEAIQNAGNGAPAGVIAAGPPDAENRRY